MPGPPLGRRVAAALVALALCTVPATATWIAATVLVAPALMAAVQAERYWTMLGLSSLVNGVAPAVALGVAWGLAGGAATGLLCGAAGWVVASLVPLVLMLPLSLPDALAVALAGVLAIAPYVAAPAGASALGGVLTVRRPLPAPPPWRPAGAVETGAVGGAAAHLASGWTLVVATAYGEPRGAAVEVAGRVALAVGAGALAGGVAAWAGTWMARLGRHHP
jgi:hypothetical protein